MNDDLTPPDPGPGDYCPTCQRDYTQLDEDETLHVEIWTPGGEVDAWICDRCVEKGRGMK
jgi:hypothetical protein